MEFSGNCRQSIKWVSKYYRTHSTEETMAASTPFAIKKVIIPAERWGIDNNNPEVGETLQGWLFAKVAMSSRRPNAAGRTCALRLTKFTTPKREHLCTMGRSGCIRIAVRQNQTADIYYTALPTAEVCFAANEWTRLRSLISGLNREWSAHDRLRLLSGLLQRLTGRVVVSNRYVIFLTKYAVSPRPPPTPLLSAR